MTIDKIGFIDPIQPGKKPGRVSQVRETPKSDSISISSEAVKKAELYRAIELAAAAPDVRAEKVAELKAKINDPSYLNDQVISATADKLIDALFG
ncbi:MAG: flagellar biosynthesis anti-sigma factor FlgM [Spirochaetaceae bacterium]|jgi:negative regulator of flagellin synthesis FlgM|nr:flagellar biosynthesis anti-sigma factor FlgM [Spirochaetaceae bacterium]